MESRKRRLRDIGRQCEMKVQKLDINYINSKNCVSTELSIDTSSSSSGKLHYLRPSNRESIQSSTMSTRETIGLSKDSKSKYSNQTSVIGNDHDTGINEDHVHIDSKIKSRVYVRDDSGYQSDDSIESPSDRSDTDESVECVEDNCVRDTTELPTEYSEHKKAVTRYLIDEGNNSVTISHQKIDSVKPGSHKEIKGKINEASENRKHCSDEHSEIDNDDGNSDDDESDVIIINEATEFTTMMQPKAIDKRSSWSRNSLNSPVETRLFNYGTLKRRYSLPARLLLDANYTKPDQESMIYIPHQFADKPIGDEFGASIRTYSIHQKDGTIYHQHFFVDVQSSGPAGKMRIANNDEIVLLNGEFVPEVTHTDLLNLFHKVKVDGRTRFKLIIRRVHTRVLKKNWEWIDTSAILAPDHHHIFDDYPVVEDKIFKKLEGNEYEIKSIQYYKVPGTQYYLDIRLDTVLADVWTATDSDKTKRICKMSRWKQDETGMICFTATLCNEAETCYIAIGQGNHIALSHSPVWFEMAAMAKNIMFKLNNMYLACNKQTGQIVASQSEFLFEELPEDGGVDRPDGAMAFLCRTKDGMPLDSDMTPRDTMMSSTTASMTSSTTSSSIVEVHNDSGYEFSNSGHSSTASSQSSSATVASASGSSGYDTYMPEEMETSPVNDVTALNIPENGFTFTTSSDLLRTPTTPLASLFIANY